MTNYLRGVTQNITRQWVDKCKVVKEMNLNGLGWYFVTRNGRKVVKTRNLKKAILTYKSISK